MLLELPDGSVELSSRCPWKDCKDQFVVHWRPEGKKAVPPFKEMNGQMFLLIQRHMKEAHKL